MIYAVPMNENADEIFLSEKQTFMSLRSAQWIKFYSWIHE